MGKKFGKKGSDHLSLKKKEIGKCHPLSFEKEFLSFIKSEPPGIQSQRYNSEEQHLFLSVSVKNLFIHTDTRLFNRCLLNIINNCFLDIKRLGRRSRR